jgi:hypothetical protein
MLDYNLKTTHGAYTQHALQRADMLSDSPCFFDYRKLDKLLSD